MKIIKKILGWFYRAKNTEKGLRQIRILFFTFRYLPQQRCEQLFAAERQIVAAKSLLKTQDDSIECAIKNMVRQNDSIMQTVSELKLKLQENGNTFKNPPQKIDKLIMTLMVKNEEDVIEEHIRFHCAMGVDGVIVTDHKSTDNTRPILQKLKEEGLVLEIITKETVDFDQHKWVNDMIRIAIDKYKADWVINSDADEFWYSKSLNLKTSILKEWPANVIGVYSTFSFPGYRHDFLRTCDFITRPLQQFEADQFSPDEKRMVKGYVGHIGGIKSMHAAEGFIDNRLGNHDVSMTNKLKLWASDIILYHYRIRSYQGWVDKCRRFEESISTYGTSPKSGAHMRCWVERLQSGKLQSDFETQYGEKVRNLLKREGVLTHDPSVYNFLIYKGIIRDE